MTDRRRFDSIYQASMRKVSKRLDDRKLDRMRRSALGGGSTSLAIVLLLLHTGADPLSLRAALCCAAVAIPVWIGAWQFVENYMFYGKRSLHHFNSVRGSGVGLGLAVAGGVLLFISLTSLIAHLSVFASALFVLASMLVAALILKQSTEVRNEVEQDEDGEG